MMQSVKGRGKCSNLQEKALILDSFGQPFMFMLPNGQKRYRSLSGTVLTVLTIVFVSLYAIYKWQLLIDREEAQINTSISEGYFYDFPNNTFS